MSQILEAPPQLTENQQTVVNKLNNARASDNQSKSSRLIKAAIKYGVITPGWSAIDYMASAAKHHGWESTCISGMKGTLKSNLMLQHGKAIYNGNMNDVKSHFVTKRKSLLDLIEYAIENDISLSWVGVDDIAALFPASLYFTHRKLYSTLQSSWETFRTIMNNFEFSCVIKKKVASFILDDITGDIKTYGPVIIDHEDGTCTYVKCHYDYRRWLWLRDLRDPTRDIAKLIAVEDIPFPVTPDALDFDPELKDGTFYAGGKPYTGADFYKNHACLTGIDTSFFKEYWNERLGLAKDSYSAFKGILDDPLPKQKKSANIEPAQPIVQVPKQPCYVEAARPPVDSESTAYAKALGKRSGEVRRAKAERLRQLEELQAAQEENDKTDE